MTNYHYTIEQLRAGRRSAKMFDFSQAALIDDLLAARLDLEANNKLLDTVLRVASELKKLL